MSEAVHLGTKEQKEKSAHQSPCLAWSLRCTVLVGNAWEIENIKYAPNPNAPPPRPPKTLPCSQCCFFYRKFDLILPVEIMHPTTLTFVGCGGPVSIQYEYLIEKTPSAISSYNLKLLMEMQEAITRKKLGSKTEHESFGR